MSGVFQNIDRPASAPRLWCGGRTHSLVGEGVGGVQYFGRRQTLLCTELYKRKYFVHIGLRFFPHRSKNIDRNLRSYTYILWNWLNPANLSKPVPAKQIEERGGEDRRRWGGGGG
jgi:hypothetical protein